MSLVKAGPAEASPTRRWPAARIEHWPIERLIPYTNNARFYSAADLGSGTSLFAVEMTGCRGSGFGVSPSYVDVVRRRWRTFTGCAARHQASGQSFDKRTDGPDRDQSGSGHG